MRLLGCVLLAAAASCGLAACPGSCSGHGYCTKDDKCVCYHQTGSRPSEMFSYFGPDCSQKTCPSAQAWADINDKDMFAPTVVFAGGDDSSQDFLRIVVDPLMNSPQKNLQFTVTVLKTGGSGYFQYQVLNEKASTRMLTSSPIEVSSHTTIATALPLKLNSQFTGVYIYWDESKAAGTFSANMFKNDEYTFIVNYNRGMQLNSGNSNTAHRFAECSGRGSCDYGTGICSCDAGYTGYACNRKSCPKDCSGHGVCQLLQRTLDDVGDANIKYSSAFDAAHEVSCLCDAGYRGPACDQIECPSKSDPMGGFGHNGIDRNGGAGDAMDCSGRGVCDYTSGLCGCFKGFTGTACEKQTNFV